MVTETQNNENIDAKYAAEDYGYESESYMHKHFDTLIEHGAKGIFDFLFSARHHDKTHIAYSYVKNPAQFEWLRNYAQNIDEVKIAEYVPEKSKVWFMPYDSNFYTKPNSINSVLKKDIFKAPWQSVADDELMFMVSGNPSDEAQIIAANFENAPASVYYGEKFRNILSPMSDRQAVYLGFRKDIGTVEGLDEFFTDEYVYNDDNVLVQVLKPVEGTQIIKETSDGKPWVIRHKNLWIVSAKDAPDTNYMSYLEETGILMNDSDYVWRDYYIKSGDSKYKIEAQLQNNTSDVSDACVIMAAYDSCGRLARVKCFKQPIMKGFNSIEAELEADENDSLIKGFVWDINMKPLNTTVFLNR